jgi:hypothetical protein
MKRWIVAVILTVFLAPALSAKSWAETFDLIGVEDPINLVATVNLAYAYDAISGIGKINISITNNSLPDAGSDPRLTAFAFNLPDGVNVLGFSSNPIAWNLLAKSNAIDTPGLFGFYDVAAITGPNFNGGNPEYLGIMRGETFFFEFLVTGPDLDKLDATSFRALRSYSRPRPAEYVQYFIGRFQRTGEFGEGSDVAIPEPTEDPEGFPGGDPV